MERGRVAEAQLEPIRIEGGRLSELYRLHADHATRLAYLITGDRALAEDLVQDAFVKLAGRLLHLRESDGFEAYLQRTVVNLANSRFRRRKVERRFAEREASMLTVTRALARAEPDVPTKEAARVALLELSPRQRTAIVLRFYVDLSEAQTAELMGWRRGTVKALVSQGMERLRPLMAGD
jgi:RNA polymerase sigma factor (sigma-70 family)